MTNGTVKNYIDENGVLVHDLTDGTILCVQPKKNNSDYYRHDFLDLEVYIRVFVDGMTSFRLPVALFNDEIYESALKNTRKNLEITTMAEILGLPPEFFDTNMDIITTKNRMFGASALLFPEIFKEYCDKKGVQKIYILPSSIHELIIVSQDIGAGYEMTRMVQEVNATELDEQDVLSNHVYLYDTSTNQITY